MHYPTDAAWGRISAWMADWMADWLAAADVRSWGRGGGDWSSQPDNAFLQTIGLQAPLAHQAAFCLGRQPGICTGIKPMGTQTRSRVGVCTAGAPAAAHPFYTRRWPALSFHKVSLMD